MTPELRRHERRMARKRRLQTVTQRLGPRHPAASDQGGRRTRQAGTQEGTQEGTR